MSALGGFAGPRYGVEAAGLASAMPQAEGLGTASGDVHAANATLARMAAQATRAC